MKTFNIHFIRHGITEANMSGAYIGATDISLAQEGILKLNRLKKDFSYPRADVVYSSYLMRCVQTANILYPEMEVETIPGLEEYNFGEWEGKTAEDLKNNEKFAMWITNSKNVSPDGGESLQDFTNRVLTTFDNLVKKIIISDKKDSVIVSHGGVIMTILTAYGVPRAKMYDWLADNGCGYSVRIIPSLWMRQQAFEVYAKVPDDMTKEKAPESAYAVDLVRQIADNVYGDENK